MGVLLSGIALFAIAYFAHVAIWNIRVPTRQASVLVLCFLLIGVLGFPIVWWRFGGEEGEIALAKLAMTVEFYSSMTAFYFLLFSAIEAESPTMNMIGIIRRHGASGISREDLAARMRAYRFVQPRLDLMLSNGMLVERGGVIVAGSRGRGLADLILRYRRFLGQRAAGG